MSSTATTRTDFDESEACAISPCEANLARMMPFADCDRTDRTRLFETRVANKEYVYVYVYEYMYVYIHIYI